MNTKNAYAIAFDMTVSELKEHFGRSYPNAYAEIKKVLNKYHFYWIQGSTYASDENDLMKITQVMNELKSIDWFCKSVRDIRVFKIEDYSEFTDFFK